MQVFYFGQAESLFGSYVPASHSTAASSVAVLCYPFGQEYMRAHKAFRQLATLLSRRGVSVLRFDYSGTRDSAGDAEDVRLARWVEDTGAAIDEAKRRAGCPSVRIAGLLLGGTVAMLAAAERTDVERLVLWDPVVRGAPYAEALDQHADLREESTSWVFGFPLTSEFRRDLMQVDLNNVHVHENTHVHQMHSSLEPQFGDLTPALVAHAGGAEAHLVPSRSDWNYADSVGGILMPVDMVKSVVQVMAD